MLLTEEQARGKWCSETRVVGATAKDGTIISAYNRITTDKETTLAPALCRCLASDCMKWRWDEGGRNFGADPSRGWCGLAGKPE